MFESNLLNQLIKNYNKKAKEVIEKINQFYDNTIQQNIVDIDYLDTLKSQTKQSAKQFIHIIQSAQNMADQQRLQIKIISMQIQKQRMCLTKEYHYQF